jgi:hypothetical protein
MPLTPRTRPAPAARANLAAIGLAAVGLMCAACGPDLADPPGTGSPIVRDSAGIRIVEDGPVASWADETRWRMSDEPIVRIGAREGPPLDDLTVNEELKEAQREQVRQRYRDMIERGLPMSMGGAERELADLTFPPALPAHGNALRAEVGGGHLWLQEYRRDSAHPHRWSVFDPDGAWLGVVETPADFSLTEVGLDYVLGIGRDELDIQYVEMYRLLKPEGSG